MSRGLMPSIVVGVVATLAALVGIDARATYGARVSGDEPQYLLSATSLGEDGDLDISDEIRQWRFTAYHAVALDTQTMPLDASGRQVSPHDPLLPALLAVPMRIGGWVGAKVVLALVAGVTAALTTWVAIRRLAVRPAPAAAGIAAAFVGLPLAAYGVQVYPEMPAALAVIGAFALLTAPRRTWRHDLGVAAAVVALPWLAVKYVPVAAVLAAVLLAGPRRSGSDEDSVLKPVSDLRQNLRGDWRRVTVLVGCLVVAGAGYLFAHQRWYGGWTVYATGDHFAERGELSVVGTQVDLLGRSRRLVGLLVDQDFGLAAWSPVWLLAPLGLGVLVGRRAPGRWIVVGVIAAGWLNATFVALTMHGYWVPGRQIVVILPLAALGLAVLADRARGWLGAVAVLGAIGAINWVWLAAESSTGRRTLIVDFTATAAWPHRAVRTLLPDGLRPTAMTTLLLGVWGVVVVALLVVGWAAGRGRQLGLAMAAGKRSISRWRSATLTR